MFEKNIFYLNFFIYLGNGWVGWRNESFPKKYVELVFEFSEVRNFTAVHIFTNNFFSKNVQVSRFYDTVQKIIFHV